MKQKNQNAMQKFSDCIAFFVLCKSTKKICIFFIDKLGMNVLTYGHHADMINTDAQAVAQKCKIVRAKAMKL